MKIAILGKGRMGSLVEALAKKSGDTTVSCSRAEELDLSGSDVCIDFSHASQVPLLVKKCIEQKVPLVIGTTGWESDFEKVQEAISKSEIGVVHSANFSVGIFLLEHLLGSFSSLLNQIEQPRFDVAIQEIHHSKKVDAPSGTALQLSKLIPEHKVEIASLRCGTFPGTHTIFADASDETITLTHTAKSRNGFATGALLAAQWIGKGRPGMFTFHQLMKDVYGI